MRRLQAILCDMDGTLVDTEPYWEEAKINLAARYDIPFSSEETAELVGKSMQVTVRRLQEVGVPLGDDEIMTFLLDEVADRIRSGAIPWIPGAQEFLARMKAADVPMALVTQAWAPVAEQIVAASDRALRVMVTGGDVTHPKPHPEPYLLAAQKLGADPRWCVAIEDSPSGVSSAEAAGAQVLVLPGMHPIEPSPNRHFIPSLHDVDVVFLESVLATD